MLKKVNPDFALGFEENGLNPCSDKACEQKNRRRIQCNTPRTLLRAERSQGKDLETFYQNPNANSGLNPALSTAKRNYEVRKSGVNRACKFFPCHAGLEDCTFCYCPLYPCRDEKLGEYVHPPNREKGIWSCQSCSWIHMKKVTAGIFALIVKNKSLIKNGPFLPKLAIHNLKNAKLGVIILSHGSRLKKANASLEKIVKATKKNTGLRMVLPAYLQFCHPNLTESVNSLIRQECKTIIITPFFLFNGNHVTRDIPGIIKKEKAKYPKTRFIYTKNLGDHLRITDIVADTVEEAIQSENNY